MDNEIAIVSCNHVDQRAGTSMKKRSDINIDDDNLTLRHRLKSKVSAMGLSVHALEKRAGVKYSAVQNIIYGRSKKPSAETLYAVARVLNCTIDDLLGNSNDSSKNADQSVASSPFLSKLYIESTKVAADILADSHQSISYSKAVTFIDEIYHYSVNNKLTSVDANFARWLFNKWWAENDKKSC